MKTIIDHTGEDSRDAGFASSLKLGHGVNQQFEVNLGAIDVQMPSDLR